MNRIFVIEVLNVNEPPVTIILKNNVLKVNENSAIGTVVGVLEAHDEDAGQSLTISLDDDAGGRFKAGKSVTCSSTKSISVRWQQKIFYDLNDAIFRVSRRYA